MDIPCCLSHIKYCNKILFHKTKYIRGHKYSQNMIKRRPQKVHSSNALSKFLTCFARRLYHLFGKHYSTMSIFRSRLQLWCWLLCHRNLYTLLSCTLSSTAAVLCFLSYTKHHTYLAQLFIYPTFLLCRSHAIAPSEILLNDILKYLGKCNRIVRRYNFNVF